MDTAKLDTVKSDVCDCLKINHNRVHEIELEDIQLEPVVQKNIYKTIAKMYSPEAEIDPAAEPALIPLGEITCKGYWIENTKELVLYVWLKDQSKAIIVPKTGWDLRSDITLH